MVEHALALQKVSQYSANGYKQLTPEGKRFSASQRHILHPL